MASTCAEASSRRSELKPALSWSNLFNGGDSPSLTDALTFAVGAGESFGIYAELSAGSYQGTADAFNTLSLAFEDDTGIMVVPEPGSGCLLSMVFLSLGVASQGAAAVDQIACCVHRTICGMGFFCEE